MTGLRTCLTDDTYAVRSPTSSWLAQARSGSLPRSPSCAPGSVSWCWRSGAGLSAASLASTIHPPTLEILDELDVLGRVIGLGRRIGTVQYRDADGVFAEFALAGLASATPFPFRLHLEQSRITPVLIDMLDASPLARVRFGAGVLHVRQDGAGVEAVLDGETVRADWAAGGGRGPERGAGNHAGWLCRRGLPRPDPAGNDRR